MPRLSNLILATLLASSVVCVDFTPVACTAANEATACKSLSDNFGGDVCCATVTTKNGSAAAVS